MLLAVCQPLVSPGQFSGVYLLGEHWPKCGKAGAGGGLLRSGLQMEGALCSTADTEAKKGA